MTTKKRQFLLVDDDGDDTGLFGEVLKEIDPSIALGVAHDGHQALRHLRAAEEKPDLIFLDLNMPRLSGRECLREIKADPQLQKIPVVMYTTSSQSRDVQDTLAAGAAGFITKPVSVKDLTFILSAFAQTTDSEWNTTLQQLNNVYGPLVVC